MTVSDCEEIWKYLDHLFRRVLPVKGGGSRLNDVFYDEGEQILQEEYNITIEVPLCSEYIKLRNTSLGISQKMRLYCEIC